MSYADHSLFTNYDGKFISIVLLYVDDIIITSNNQEEIKKVKINLKEKFGIKDLCLLKYFLKIEIAHYSKGLSILQRKICVRFAKRS